jgi:hypothetical protein
LVARRQVRKKWKKPAIIIVVLLVLALLAQIFLPITLDGWRETNQRDFTTEAAYWRARDVVRNQRTAQGRLVAFDGLGAASVQLEGTTNATVHLRGSVTDKNGEWRPTGWRVTLQYDPKLKEWTGLTAQESSAQ